MSLTLRQTRPTRTLLGGQAWIPHCSFTAQLWASTFYGYKGSWLIWLLRLLGTQMRPTGGTVWGGASRSLADGLVSPMPWFCEGPWCSRSSGISTPGSGHQAAAASTEPYQDPQASLSWPHPGCQPGPKLWAQGTDWAQGLSPSAGRGGESGRERPEASGREGPGTDPLERAHARPANLPTKSLTNDNE